MPAVLLTSLLLLAAADDVPGVRQHAELAVGFAQAGILDDRNEPLRYGVEYRFRALGDWQLYPVTGVITTDGADFFYVDVRRDFEISENWFISASFGAGRFDPDHVLDLGHLLEFRSGVSVSRRFHDRLRVELGLYHFPTAAFHAGTRVRRRWCCRPGSRSVPSKAPVQSSHGSGTCRP